MPELTINSVPLKTGHILLFSGHLTHLKGNATDKSRTSLYATYYMAKDGLDVRSKYHPHRSKVFFRLIMVSHVVFWNAFYSEI